MDFTVLLVSLVPCLLLVLLGYLIRFRRMYFLISGYNTMPAEKKKRVDTEGLGRLMGNSLFAMGGIVFAGMTLMAARLATAGLIVLLSIVPVIVYLLITAQKHDGSTRDESGRMKTGIRILIAVIIAFLLVLTGGIAYSLDYNSKPVTVVTTGQTMEIKGMYGLTIERAAIKGITFQETLPAILRRTNGFAVGSHLKGNFTMETFGHVKLYIDRSIPSFIIIQTAGSPIILNQGSVADTKALYDALVR